MPAINNFLKRIAVAFTGKLFTAGNSRSQSKNSQPHKKLLVPGFGEGKMLHQRQEALSDFTIF